MSSSKRYKREFGYGPSFARIAVSRIKKELPVLEYIDRGYIVTFYRPNDRACTPAIYRPNDRAYTPAIYRPNNRAYTPTINRPTNRQALGLTLYLTLYLTTIITVASAVLPPGQTAAILAADSNLTVAALPTAYQYFTAPAYSTTTNSCCLPPVAKPTLYCLPTAPQAQRKNCQ